MSQYLFLLLVLACPLMMIFMMRGHGQGAGGRSHGGGHAGCSHGSHGSDDQQSHEPVSVDELRRRRDELDRRISEREWQGERSGDHTLERV